MCFVEEFSRIGTSLIGKMIAYASHQLNDMTRTRVELLVGQLANFMLKFTLLEKSKGKQLNGPQMGMIEGMS